MEETNAKVYKLTKKERQNIADSQFGSDLVRGIGMFNLIVSNRDFSLWTRGMKPTRSWQFRVARDYFGFTGNKFKVQQNCRELLDSLQSIEKSNKEEVEQ